MSQKRISDKDFREERIAIAGFSENRREDMLKAQKTAKARQGWRFVSYHEDGMKSYAIFMAPKKRLPLKTIGIVTSIIVVLIVGILLIPKPSQKTGDGGTATTTDRQKQSKKLEIRTPTPQKSNGQEHDEALERKQERQKGDALLWQKAGYKEKLKACRTLTTAMWKQNRFRENIRSRIASAKDLEPYAEELLKALDVALKKDPDPIKNKRLYEYETITQTAMQIAKIKGWLK